MAIQKVRKYDRVQHKEVFSVGSPATNVSFDQQLSAVDISVRDDNDTGSPVLVRFDGVTTVTGSGYELFDGDHRLFEVRIPNGQSVSLFFNGSPTLTADVSLLGFFDQEDI